MKVPKVFATRAAANEKAADLRKVYLSVLVYRTGTGYGVSYEPGRLRANLKKGKK